MLIIPLSFELTQLHPVRFPYPVRPWSAGLAAIDWYKNLKKPSWTPPAPAFPIVWTTLYVLMGYASWLVFKDGGFDKNTVALGLYAVQLFFNFWWTPLFFGMHKLDVALVDIALLWISVVATTVAFWGVNPTAGYLFLPYILWVSIATALNLWIVQHNDKPYDKTYNSGKKAE
eukprot:SM000187S03892  [mRNA]  locus=s187:226924:228767:- [translate_table: standard]